MHLAWYSKHLQDSCQPQQAYEAEELECRIKQRYGRQDRQQVNDCHKRKRIGEKRYLAVVASDISCTPAKQVINDEHKRRSHFRKPKHFMRLHEHQREKAYENGQNHKPVISRTHPIGMWLPVYYVCNLLSIHITKWFLLNQRHWISSFKELDKLIQSIGLTNPTHWTCLSNSLD